MRVFETPNISETRGRNLKKVDIPLELENPEDEKKKRLQREKELEEKIRNEVWMLAQYNNLLSALEEAKSVSLDIPIVDDDPSPKTELAILEFAKKLSKVSFLKAVVPSQLREESRRMFLRGTAAFDEEIAKIKGYKDKTEQDIADLRKEQAEIIALEDPDERSARLTVELTRRETLNPYFKDKKALEKNLGGLKEMPKVTEEDVDSTLK